jgi:hypothetical protein
MDIDNEWDNFMDDTIEEPDKISVMRNSEAPISSEIYISTKSMIAHLNQEIDLKIFWEIPVIPYSTPANGIIKKQIKYNSQTPEELLMIQENIKKVEFDSSGRFDFSSINNLNFFKKHFFWT